MQSDAVPTIADAFQEAIEAFDNLEVAKYLTLVALTLLCYDYFLTLKYEIRLVWPANWGTPKVLFFINRYFPFLDAFLLTHVLVTGDRSSLCIPYVQISAYAASYGIVIAEVILMMRAWAIWNRVWYLTVILGCLLAIDIATPIIVNRLYFAGMTSITSPFPVIKGCLLMLKNRVIYIDFTIVIISETLCLALLTIKAFQHFQQSRTNVMREIFRDGVLYYAAILLVSIANLCAIILAPNEINFLLVLLQRVIHSVCCTRVLLHIRSAYSKANDTDTDSDSDRFTSVLTDTQAIFRQAGTFSVAQTNNKSRYERFLTTEFQYTGDEERSATSEFGNELRKMTPEACV